MKASKSLVNSCYRLPEYRFSAECLPRANPLKSPQCFRAGGHDAKDNTWVAFLQAALNFERFEKQQEEKDGEKRVDSPEEDCLSLSHGDVVHHFVVGVRIPLAADRQPCRHKKQNPQREKNCAFAKSDKVSPHRHRLQPSEV